MAFIVFKRARDVGFLKDSKTANAGENVVACELEVGRDVKEEVGRSLAGA
jgi:hypothetical protein